MRDIRKPQIDWSKTGSNLQQLRLGNISLRRFVCYTLNHKKGECSGDCEQCLYEMDRSISRVELGKVFHVSEPVVVNWESGRTPVPLEELLFYAEITAIPPRELVVFL